MGLSFSLENDEKTKKSPGIKKFVNFTKTLPGLTSQSKVQLKDPPSYQLFKATIEFKNKPTKNTYINY